MKGWSWCIIERDLNLYGLPVFADQELSSDRLLPHSHDT